MKTIFAVDDSLTILAAVKAALEDTYRIVTFPSASEMFGNLETETPDLIILDIEMPEMDGHEALHRLKSNEPWNHIPVIQLTSRDDAHTVAHSFALGATDFIIKPISAPLLRERVTMYLERVEPVCT